MRLFDAIKIAHMGKHETIDVKKHGYYSTWDAEEDAGWQAYLRARNVLYAHGVIYKILQWIGYI